MSNEIEDVDETVEDILENCLASRVVVDVEALLTCDGEKCEAEKHIAINKARIETIKPIVDFLCFGYFFIPPMPRANPIIEKRIPQKFPERINPQTPKMIEAILSF